MEGQRESNHHFINYPYTLCALDVEVQAGVATRRDLWQAEALLLWKAQTVRLQVRVFRRFTRCRRECLDTPSGVSLRSCDLPAPQRQARPAAEEKRAHARRPRLRSRGEREPVHVGDARRQGVTRHCHKSARSPPEAQSTRKRSDPDEIVRNQRVSADHVIVNHYFGQLCGLWPVMFTAYTWVGRREVRLTGENLRRLD